MCRLMVVAATLCALVCGVFSQPQPAPSSPCTERGGCADAGSYCYINSKCCVLREAPADRPYWYGEWWNCTKTGECLPKKAAGESCRRSQECVSQSCMNRVCAECTYDDDCAAGQYCVAGWGETRPPTRPPFGPHPEPFHLSAEERNKRQSGGGLVSYPGPGRDRMHVCASKKPVGAECDIHRECETSLCDGGLCVSVVECQYVKERGLTIGCQANEECWGVHNPWLRNTCIQVANCTANNQCPADMPICETGFPYYWGNDSPIRPGLRGKCTQCRRFRYSYGPEQENDCAENQYCEQGRCFDKKVDGDRCRRNDECVSESCDSRPGRRTGLCQPHICAQPLCFAPCPPGQDYLTDSNGCASCKCGPVQK